MIPVVDEVALGAKLLSFGQKYWPYIVGALVVAGLVAWAFIAHGHAKDAYGAQRYTDGYKAAVADQLEAQRLAAARAQQINTPIRKKNDETNRHIAADADALRLRGPGRATCSSVAAASNAAGGHDAGRGETAAAVAVVPNQERPQLIALPFAGTVAAFQQCDANRAEVLSWRQSDSQQATQSQQEK